MEMDSQLHSPVTLSWSYDPIPVVLEDVWSTGRVWKGAEKVAATGIRSSDRPTHSEELYRLFYSSPRVCLNLFYYYPPIDDYIFQVTSSVCIFLSKVCIIFSSSPVRPSHPPWFSMSLILLCKQCKSWNYSLLCSSNFLLLQSSQVQMSSTLYLAASRDWIFLLTRDVNFHTSTSEGMEHAVSQFVETLLSRPKDRGFYSRL